MSAPDPLLSVRDLRITAGTGTGAVPLTAGIDLDLAPGEALGIVGESGSGKSMLARSITGLLPDGVRATGSVRWRGQQLLGTGGRDLRRIRGTQIAMIFQDPFTMLSPLMTCGDQIVEMLRDGRGRRLRRAARRDEAVRRLDEVGIGDPAVADAYPFELSGGMRQRVGIAAAMARDPDLVIADEPTTALDVTTQQEILTRLQALQRSRGMSLILITHDLRVAFSVTDRVGVLYAGSMVEQGGSDAVGTRPRHPYTLALLQSEPPADRRLARLDAIPGSVARAADVEGMCAFAPRCDWALPSCHDGRPQLRLVEDGRSAACVRVDELADRIAERRSASLLGNHTPPRRIEAGDPVVAVTGLGKVFGGSRRRTVALRDVDLEVLEGESVGIVGESGSGKTTLGRCLVGLERPSTGRVVIGGIDATDFAALSRADHRRVRRTIQMVFQDPFSTLNAARTIGATLGEAVRANDAETRDVGERVVELLELVGLSADHHRRKPVALSGGQRQRVAIARALAARPRVVVCDEAVSALDVSVQAQILNLLNTLRDELGVALLFITHDLAVVRQVTDRIYVARHGEIVEAGPTDEVLDRPAHSYTRRLVASAPHSDASLTAR